METNEKTTEEIISKTNEKIEELKKVLEEKNTNSFQTLDNWLFVLILLLLFSNKRKEE